LLNCFDCHAGTKTLLPELKFRLPVLRVPVSIIFEPIPGPGLDADYFITNQANFLERRSRALAAGTRKADERARESGGMIY